MERVLKELFKDIEIVGLSGTLKRPVSSLVTDSRRAVDGSLFFALPGVRTDGSYFIEEAIDRGASAVVTEEARRPHAGVTFIQVADARRVMAEVARCFYSFPDRSLTLFGVTGAYGKTTVVHLIRHLLGACGLRAGSTGSLAYDLGSRTVPSTRTTPDSPEMAGMMAEMTKAGLTHAVLEIDTAGISRKSPAGLGFRVAVFLNLDEKAPADDLSPDEAYALMRGMFTGAEGALPACAVIPLDESRGRRLLSELPEGVTPVTFGTGSEASVRARDVKTDPRGTRMILEWPEGRCEVTIPLVGEYNGKLFLAAAAAAYAGGLDPAVFCRAMTAFPGIPGRMERIDEGQPFHVFVDHAHTGGTLGNALQALRDLGCGRVLAVFGCGGKGERSLRAPMVRTVQERTDFSWATADNPRGEDLQTIFDDMKKGVRNAAAIAFVEDRREAIRRALESAREGDCVLIAGKGNELFQDMGDTLLPFDDRRVVRECLTVQKTGNI